MRLVLVLGPLLLAACHGEYDLKTASDVLPGTEPAAHANDDDDSGDADDDDDYNDGLEDPDYDPSDDDGDGPTDPGNPPSDACTEGEIAEFDSTQIVVLSWSQTTDSGVLTASETGWYHIYDTAPSESGNGQWNESTSFRVTNATVSMGLPAFTNCGDDYVVLDSDNYGPSASGRIYIGTFWLDAGPNTVTMEHYCPRYRAGECTSLHNPDDSGSTCDSSNANSAHFDGYGICLVPA